MEAIEIKEILREILGEVKNDSVLSPEQASEFLGINLNKIYELCHADDFPSARIGRKWVIIKDELIRWVLEEGKRQKQEERALTAQLFRRSG